MIRILGVDVGTVRVGLALSDPLGLTAQPLEVVIRKQRDPGTRIRELVDEHHVQRIVVGQPYSLSGEESPATDAVASFVKDLRTRVTCPIELWDERLTSVQAERAMIEGGASRKKRRAELDKVAASFILQSYLDAHSGTL
ncbi:MAG: Holliday junction resolvase RuvX [Myxococcota bacterium]